MMFPFEAGHVIRDTHNILDEIKMVCIVHHASLRELLHEYGDDPIFR